MREGRINLDYSKQYCILSPCTSGHLCTATCYEHVTNMPLYMQLYFPNSESASLKMLVICYWVISQVGINAENSITDNNLIYCKLT